MMTEANQQTEMQNTLQTPEQVAEQIKNEIKPTLEEKLVEARQLLTEHEKHSKSHEVTTSSGERKTVDQLIKEAKELTEQWHLEALENKREREARAAQSPIPYLADGNERKWRPRESEPEPPVLRDSTDWEKLFGLKGWADLSPEQRAKARAIRQSEIDAMPLEKYFGPSSSGRLANDLARTDPGRYQLLRRRAVKENLLGV